MPAGGEEKEEEQTDKIREPLTEVRERGLQLSNIWPHFGAIFDEKNDKKAMRSYTVFKYPKMVDFWMEKRCRNEAKK